MVKINDRLARLEYHHAAINILFVVVCLVGIVLSSIITYLINKTVVDALGKLDTKVSTVSEALKPTTPKDVLELLTKVESKISLNSQKIEELAVKLNFNSQEVPE